jgi:hypothetical protein
MSGVSYRTITQITPEIPQTSLHKHGTITQITPEIPQASIHKHWTITQNPADTPQTSLHKHGMPGVFYIIARVYVKKFEVCQE